MPKVKEEKKPVVARATFTGLHLAYQSIVTPPAKHTVGVADGSVDSQFDFHPALKKASRRISQPVAKMK